MAVTIKKKTVAGVDPVKFMVQAGIQKGKKEQQIKNAAEAVNKGITPTRSLVKRPRR